MPEGMRRLAFVLTVMTCSLFVVTSCSSTSPTPSPTAIRLIAGTYHYLVKSASCPDWDSGFYGPMTFNSVTLSDLDPVQLSQTGSTVTIDSHQTRLPIGPTSTNLQLSGTISGATLSFQFSGGLSAGHLAEKAEGHGFAAINGQSISGRFSGTASYLTLLLNFPYGAFVPCTSDDHSIVLTRVS